MMKYLKIVILLSLLQVVTLNEYGQDHTVVCSNINDDWTFQQNLSYLWNIIILHSIDRYVFLIVCPILLILQAFIIYTFLAHKLYASTPMDIILAFFVCQFSQNVISLMNGVYFTINTYNNPMPASFAGYCIGTAVILSFFTTLEVVYIFFFLFFIVLSVRKKSIKKNPFYRGKMKHFIAFLFTGLTTLGLYFFSVFGFSQLGICAVTTTRKSDFQFYIPLLQLIISFSFLVSAFFTFRYFKSHVIAGNSLNRRQYIENIMITKFVVGMSIFMTLFSIALIILYANCINPRPNFLIWATVFNLTKIMQSIYLLIIMFTYQKISKKLKKTARGLFSKGRKTNLSQSSAGDSELGKVSTIQRDEFFDVGLKQKILDIQQQENQIDFITVSQILSILIGIKITYKEYIIQTTEKVQKIKNLYFFQQVSFNIHSNLINQYEHEATILPRLTLLKAKFTIYSPKIFQSLINQDCLKAIESSFDLILNRNQLYKIYESQGGRSGEFFFFTSDHKYILKTVNKQQFTFLIEYMTDFYKHFTNYPHSLISKVYGMFRIDYAEVDQKYYILLMKNVSGCSKSQVIRTYDMKGSTHQRQVLKTYDNVESYELKRRVLKDLDFVELQQKVQIDNLSAKNIKNQLIVDTQFLQELNIIDYSLLLMRVNWLRQPQSVTFWGKLNRIESSITENEFYHIVLIDYLQKWDKKKQSEKWWKNLFGNKDTSAAEPSIYQSRFMSFIYAIFANDSIMNTVNMTQYASENKCQLIHNLKDKLIKKEIIPAIREVQEEFSPNKKAIREPLSFQINEL